MLYCVFEKYQIEKVIEKKHVLKKTYFLTKSVSMYHYTAKTIVLNFIFWTFNHLSDQCVSVG